MPLDVSQLGPGVWRWSAPHPDWTPDEAGPDGWGPEVASHYVEVGGAIALIDPQLPPEGPDLDRFLEHLDADAERAGGELAVLLTCGWHERSAALLAARYGATIWLPEASRGATGAVETSAIADGDELPGGVRAHVTDSGDPEAVFVLPWEGALVTGDIVLGDGAGGLRVAPATWYDQDDAQRAFYRERLAPFLRAAAAHGPGAVLPAHGEPVLDGAAAGLQRAVEKIR